MKMIFISLSIAAWMKRLIKSLLIFPLEWKDGKLIKGIAGIHGRDTGEESRD